MKKRLIFIFLLYLIFLTGCGGCDTDKYGHPKDGIWKNDDFNITLFFIKNAETSYGTMELYGEMVEIGSYCQYNSTLRIYKVVRDENGKDLTRYDMNIMKTVMRGVCQKVDDDHFILIDRAYGSEKEDLKYDFYFAGEIENESEESTEDN